MSDKTAKLISVDRVIQILECYGADENHWPENERTAAMVLVKQSALLQQRQEETRQLDLVLQIDIVKNGYSRPADITAINKIMANLPEQELHSHLNNQNQANGAARKIINPWRKYTMAAAVASVFITTVILIQNSRTFTTTIEPSQAELDSWMWEQVAGPLTTEDTEEPLTLMALVDLELSPPDE
jgi:hypothetical protein